MQAEAWELAKGKVHAQRFVKYQFDPADYIQTHLDWEPWASGDDEKPGQVEILDSYALALKQQHERLEWEKGKPERYLTCWKPGQVIKNRIRVQAGHTLGKTKLASGIVSHFFDCFDPAIVYTFAPSWHQIQNLLWKEIRADRANKDLRGTVLDGKPAITYTGNHFATGLATSDAKGMGTERAQGQHGKYLLFVLDEAEGVADFVWSAIDSMTSGGIAIVLMIGNPRTRSSNFYKQRRRSTVKSFSMSCLDHPNVLAGKELVEGAVRRDYVAEMMEEHVEVVGEHEPEAYTFELPWDTGTVYKPDDEFQFRVLGIAPENQTHNTLISVGAYSAAKKRTPEKAKNPYIARIGVDVARFGNDVGTIYCCWNNEIWRHAVMRKQDYVSYAGSIIDLCKSLKKKGVSEVHIRIDAGGGFGGGVNDLIKNNIELNQMFNKFETYEVHFGGTPYDDKAFADLITEMYASAGKSLKHLSIKKPPELLEIDLTERTYKWVQPRQGVTVKKLESKDKFKQDNGHSPDDGDGFVLAAAPDHLFVRKVARARSRV